MNEDVPRCDEWTEHDFKSMYGIDDPEPTLVAEGEVKGQFGVGIPGAGQDKAPQVTGTPTLIHLATGLAVATTIDPTREDYRDLAERLSGMPDTSDVEEVEKDAEKWSTIVEKWLDEVTP